MKVRWEESNKGCGVSHFKYRFQLSFMTVVGLSTSAPFANNQRTAFRCLSAAAKCRGVNGATRRYPPATWPLDKNASTRLPDAGAVAPARPSEMCGKARSKASMTGM